MNPNNKPIIAEEADKNFKRKTILDRARLNLKNESENKLEFINDEKDEENKNIVNAVILVGPSKQEKAEETLLKKETNLSKKDNNTENPYYTSITEIQQVKKSLYKNFFFKNFYKKISDEEAKKIFFTSILKLNEVKLDSSLENPLHLSFCLALDKVRVNTLKATIKKYITNYNIMSVLINLKDHVQKKFNFVEEFISSSLKQIEVERENIKKLNLEGDHHNALKFQKKIREDLEIIKLEMEKRHGIQEERDMLKYKLWIKLLLALYHKEIDFWIPLFRECYQKYQPDEFKKAVQTAYQHFQLIKDKFFEYEKELNSRSVEFQAIKEYPIHLPGDLTIIYLEQNQVFEAQLSNLYKKLTNLLEELFRFLMKFLKVYFLVFYLNRLRLDKDKAVQNDIARINLMDYEQQLTEKSNFWYTHIEIRRSQLEQLHLGLIQKLINEKSIALHRIQNARIDKVESEIVELKRRIAEIEYKINESNGFIGTLKNLKINPLRTIIKKGISIAVSQLAPGIGDIFSNWIIGANPPFPFIDSVVDSSAQNKNVNNNNYKNFNHQTTLNIQNPNFDNQNRIMKKYNGDEDDDMNTNTNDPAAPVTMGFVEKFISESKWGAMNLFAGKHSLLEEDPVSEMERENLKSGKIDFDAIYNFQQLEQKKFPKEMELKLQAVEMINNLEKTIQFYGQQLEESIAREKEKLEQTIAIYEKYNGMLKQMYASDYASRLYKNRESMENFYFEKLMNQHMNFKNTNYDNIITQTQYYFSNEFISKMSLSLDIVNEFASKISNISPTGCCISFKNKLCGIYQMNFFKDTEVKIEELHALFAKKIRKRLMLKNQICYKTANRLKSLKLCDLISISCSKEFWSISKDCVKESFWDCNKKYDSITQQFSGPYKKKLLLDYDLNTHANNVKDFIFSRIMLDAYKISS